MLLARRKTRVLALALGLSAALGARPATAALVGSIFSGPTSADAAAVYWNPAAMSLLAGSHGMLFGAVSAIRLHYQRDTPSLFDGQGLPQADVFIPKPAPVLAVVTDATLKDFRFGVAVTLPILDGATWDTEYGGRPASTRYYAINARLLSFMIEPAIAYRINRYVSIGFGIDIIGTALTHDVMTDFGGKINQMACASQPESCAVGSPLPREDPSLDARTKVSGVGWGVGVSGGLLVTPWPWLRLGFGIHSGAPSVTIPAELAVELPQSVVDYVAANLPSVSLPALTADGEVELTVPMIVTAGISVTPWERLELAADLHWMNTSATSVMLGTITRDRSSGLIADQVLIKARSDFYLVGLIGKLQLIPQLRLALRVEYEANTRPERYTSPVSIDFHKISIHAGCAWRPLSWLALSLEYGHYFLFARTVRSSAFAPNPNPTTAVEEGLDKPPPSGRYWVEADRVGVGAYFSF